MAVDTGLSSTAVEELAARRDLINRIAIPIEERRSSGRISRPANTMPT
jgi:hypothetical protein